MTPPKWLRLGIIGLLCAIATPLGMTPPAQADRRIIIRSPSHAEPPSRGEQRSSERRRSPHHEHPSSRRQESSHGQRRSGRRHRYPIYERRQPVQRQVTVEFIAQGDEWANVFVNDRRVFSPTNYANRRQRFTFREGAYDIKITGVDFFDVWAEGYLDVGRDDTNIIVVSFSERRGITVSGDPHAWIPLSARR